MFWFTQQIHDEGDQTCPAAIWQCTGLILIIMDLWSWRHQDGCAWPHSEIWRKVILWKKIIQVLKLKVSRLKCICI